MVPGATTVGVMLHHKLRCCCAPIAAWAEVSPDEVYRLQLTGYSLHASTYCYKNSSTYYMYLVLFSATCARVLLHNRSYSVQIS